MKSVISLTRLLDIVSATLMLDADLVRRPSKSRAPAAARGIISNIAIFELGYTGSEVSKFLHLGPTGVSLASRRGEKILKSDPMMLKVIMGSIEKQITASRLIYKREMPETVDKKKNNL